MYIYTCMIWWYCIHVHVLVVSAAITAGADSHWQRIPGAPLKEAQTTLAHLGMHSKWIRPILHHFIIGYTAVIALVRKSSWTKELHPKLSNAKQQEIERERDRERNLHYACVLGQQLVLRARDPPTQFPIVEQTTSQTTNSFSNELPFVLLHSMCVCVCASVLRSNS